MDVVDLKEIIESPANWPHFQATYSLAMPDEKKGKKFYTSWIVKYNDLRKIAAHKNELRTYSDEDLEFIDWLSSELLPKIDLNT